MLRGEAPFALREDVVNPKARRRRVAEAVAAGDADAELLAALKALRGAIAAAQKQPAYVIFPDRTLIEIAKRRPRSLDELAGVHGVGAVKLQKYGRGVSRCDAGRGVAERLSRLRGYGDGLLTRDFMTCSSFPTEWRDPKVSP